jgi:kelch-like protein 18
VQLYGKIYALGGHNGLSIFESVEEYDTATDTWSESVPMLSKRCRLGVSTLNGKIYACGGYDGSSFLKSVECFDPVANT